MQGPSDPFGRCEEVGRTGIEEEQVECLLGGLDKEAGNPILMRFRRNLFLVRVVGLVGEVAIFSASSAPGMILWERFSVKIPLAVLVSLWAASCLFVGCRSGDEGPSIPDDDDDDTTDVGDDDSEAEGFFDGGRLLVGEPGSRAGTAVDTAGDVDGDGVDDLVVGASMYTFSDEQYGVGAVYVLRGPLLDDGPDLFLAEDSHATFFGPASHAFAGRAVSAAGDTDGDGQADILVGAPGVEDYTGAAYLVRGPATGPQSLAEQDATLLGEHEHDQAGYAVSCAGDVNGDGLSDVLVGAPYRDTDDGDDAGGAAYLLLGPIVGEIPLSESTAIFLGEQGGDYAGLAVANAGDVNGDGLGDLLVGAPFAYNGRGTVYLLSGPREGTLSLATADVMLLGDRSGYEWGYEWVNGDLAGYSVAGTGDVNADGLADIAVGLPGYGADTSDIFGHGAASLVHGPIEETRAALGNVAVMLLGTEPGEGIGHSVAGAGDVNGDGHDDLLVSGGGTSYLFLAPISDEPELAAGEAKFESGYGGEVGSHAVEVSAAGDLNADGFDDVAIGVWRMDANGDDSGGVHLFFGRPD